MMKLLSRVLVFSIFTVSTSAFAYLTVGESNEIPALGNYRMGGDLQLKMSDGGGANVTGFFDLPLNQESSMRFHAGFGDTDFYGGGSIKWVPYPDIDSQPAIGIKGEIVLGSENSESLVIARVMPLVSKRFNSEYGDFVPYGALPIGFSTYKSQNDTSIFVVGGSEYYKQDLQQWSFGAELGLNASKAFTYVSLYATYAFDKMPKLQRR